MEQVSVLQRRIQVQDAAPFVDFAFWVPYGQRAMKAAKFRSFVLTASGYATKELLGPTFVQWRTSFRILRTVLIVLDAASLAALHNGHRKADEDLPDSLAPHLCSGRTCAVGPLQPSQGEGAHGHEGRENTTSKLGSEKALGLCLHDDCGGRQLLAYASPCPGFDLDGSWKPWYSQNPRRTTCHRLHDGRGESHHTANGDGRQRRWRRFQLKKDSKAQQKKEKRRRRRVGQWWRARHCR